MKGVYTNNFPGSLFRHTPARNGFEDLVRLTSERNVWRAFVRNLPHFQGNSAPLGGVE